MLDLLATLIKYPLHLYYRMTPCKPEFHVWALVKNRYKCELCHTKRKCVAASDCVWDSHETGYVCRVCEWIRPTKWVD